MNREDLKKVRSLVAKTIKERLSIWRISFLIFGNKHKKKIAISAPLITIAAPTLYYREYILEELRKLYFYYPEFNDYQFDLRLEPIPDLFTTKILIPTPKSYAKRKAEIKEQQQKSWEERLKTFFTDDKGNPRLQQTDEIVKKVFPYLPIIDFNKDEIKKDIKKQSKWAIDKLKKYSDAFNSLGSSKLFNELTSLDVVSSFDDLLKMLSELRIYKHCTYSYYYHKDPYNDNWGYGFDIKRGLHALDNDNKGDARCYSEGYWIIASKNDIETGRHHLKDKGNYMVAWNDHTYYNYSSAMVTYTNIPWKELCSTVAVLVASAILIKAAEVLAPVVAAFQTPQPKTLTSKSKEDEAKSAASVLGINYSIILDAIKTNKDKAGEVTSFYFDLNQAAQELSTTKLVYAATKLFHGTIW